MNEFGKAIAARFDADEFNPGWCVGSPVSHVLELFATARGLALGPLARRCGHGRPAGGQRSSPHHPAGCVAVKIAGKPVHLTVGLGDLDLPAINDLDDALGWDTSGVAPSEGHGIESAGQAGDDFGGCGVAHVII